MGHSPHDKLIIEMLQKYSPLSFADLYFHFHESTGRSEKTLQRRLAWLVTGGSVIKNGETKGVTYHTPTINAFFIPTSDFIDQAVTLIEDTIPDTMQNMKLYLETPKPPVGTDVKIFNQAFTLLRYFIRIKSTIMEMVDFELPSDKQQFIYKKKVFRISTSNLEMLLLDMRSIWRKYKLQLKEMDIVFYSRLHNLIFKDLDTFRII